MRRVAVVAVLALVPIVAGGCGGSHHATSCSVIFRAVPPSGQTVTPAGMQIAQKIAINRLDTLGVSSPTVAVHGDELVIEGTGVRNPAEVAKIIRPTGQLQMFDFEPSLVPPTVTRNRHPAPFPSLYALLETVQKEANDGSPQSYYLFKTGNPHRVVQGPAPTLHELFQPTKGGKQPPHTQVLRVPAGTEPVRCGGVANCPGAGSNGTSQDGTYWYLFKLPPALTGKDLVESGIAADAENTGQPIVTLPFTPKGSAAFKRLTRAEYNRGRVNAGLGGQLNARNAAMINRYAGHNAIVLDGQLEETPYIDYTNPILSRGIIGNAQITEPSAQAASRTALVLQSGSLPYTFRLVGTNSCHG
jgi:preprotein translocase subunit SecD